MPPNQSPVKQPLPIRWNKVRLVTCQYTHLVLILITLSITINLSSVNTIDSSTNSQESKYPSNSNYNNNNKFHSSTANQAREQIKNSNVQAKKNQHNESLPSQTTDDKLNLISPRSIIVPQNTNSSLHKNNYDQDRLSEGSGNGPIFSHHKAKFDDTEEGDDDDDDEEDYDYKEGSDIGSGNGYNKSKSNKMSIQTASTNPGNDPEKKVVASSESDIYLPYRHTTNNKDSTTMIQNTIKPIALLEPNVTRAAIDITTARFNSSGQQTGSIVLKEHDMLMTSQKAPNPKHIVDPVQKTITVQPTPTDRPHIGRPNLSSENPIVTNLSPNIEKRTNFTYIPLLSTSTEKTNGINLNGSSSTKPSSGNNSKITNSKITDVDYDYEDENDDDESEDTSNFEDNETPDTNVTSSTANNNAVLKPLILPTKQPHTTPKPATILITTPKLVETSTTTTNPPKSPVTLQAPTTKYPTITFVNHAQSNSTINNNLITVQPSITTSSGTDKLDQTDEDQDDFEDEEDEEEEEEMIDEDDQDEEVGFKSEPNPRLNNKIPDLSTNTQEWFSPSPKPITQPTSQSKPSIKPMVDTEITTIPAVPVNTEPNHNRPSEFPSSTLSPMLSSTEAPIKRLIFTSTIKPSTTLSTTQVPISTTLRPMMNPLPATTMNSLSQIPNLFPTRSPPISVMTQDYTQNIEYPTTPKFKTSITYTQDPTIYRGYNGILQEDDMGLTKQFYDMAVEVYQTTNKAIEAAVGALTSFELNKKTFEPLFADSFLFMLALGAFVMILVLTMMLVVYIVDKKIQPRVMDYYTDDASIY